MYCSNKIKELNNRIIKQLPLNSVSIRKGFTLVEMAMVLIVTGIIFTMVMVGFNVLDEVRIRAELAKIDKLRNATLTYVNLTNNTPPIGTDGRVDISVYIKKELIEGIDIKSSLSSTGRYHLVPCYSVKKVAFDTSSYGDKPTLFLYVPPTGVGGGNIKYVKLTQLCVSHTDPTFASGSEPLESFPINVVCRYETLVDDTNHFFGSGRQACLNGSPDDCGSLNKDILDLLSAAAGGSGSIPNLEYTKRAEAWDKGCDRTIPNRRQSYAIRVY